MTKMNKILIIVGGFIALISWIWINAHYKAKKEEIKKQYFEKARSLRNKWNKEEQERKRAYRAELENAWGGGIKAVLRDPNLSISEMLRKAALTAFPDSGRVEVKIDNFNEFDVFIHVKETVDKDKASQAIKFLISNCGKYVNSVSFVYNGEVVKTIDRRGIDSIEDWESADLDSVAGQMYTP
jgi:hypothetical protein